MIPKLICFLVRHTWHLTGKAPNWLNGGLFFYECDRCGKTKTEIHYRGGLS